MSEQGIYRVKGAIKPHRWRKTKVGLPPEILDFTHKSQSKILTVDATIWQTKQQVCHSRGKRRKPQRANQTTYLVGHVYTCSISNIAATQEPSTSQLPKKFGSELGMMEMTENDQIQKAKREKSMNIALKTSLQETSQST